MSKDGEAATADTTATNTRMTSLTIAEDTRSEESTSTSILLFLFEALTLVVSVIILVLMVIYPVEWPMFYLGFGSTTLASICGVVAIRTRLYGFHIPCIVCAILATIGFLAVIVITSISIIVLEQEWEYEHVIVYISFNAIWMAVSLALTVRHIILYRLRRASRNAQPLSYKHFGEEQICQKLSSK